MIKNFLQLFLVVYLLVLAINPVYSAQNRVALVIGNSSYKDFPLKNPRNDATDMADRLKRHDFKVTKLNNANQRTMETAIADFGKLLQQKKSVGLFYFAGHGVQVNGSNYLIPIGANINSEADVRYEAVNAGRVLSQMSLADNGLNMLILDACRNNPYARSFRSASRGLARMQAPSGSLILYATSPGNLAADGSARNGLFTEKLMQSMDKKGLKIEDVFKQTAIAVSRETKKQQIPYFEGVILGDFYFTHPVTMNMPPVDVTATSKDISTNAESEYWLEVKSDPTIEMYEVYLEEYPNGHYSRLARLKLKKLMKEIFIQNCAECHGKNGEGKAGFPVLTDNDWIAPLRGAIEQVRNALVMNKRIIDDDTPRYQDRSIRHANARSSLARYTVAALNKFRIPLEMVEKV